MLGLLKTVKRYAEQGIITVDTAVNQKTAVKKVRMIQIANDETLQTVLDAMHANAKKQIELIALDERACRTIDYLRNN